MAVALLACARKSDGNYRPDLKGLRHVLDDRFRDRPNVFDGNYRPDLKGLRRNRLNVLRRIGGRDGNYRPDLKGLRLCGGERLFVRQQRGMEITDLI